MTEIIGKIQWLPGKPTEYPAGSEEFNVGIKVNNNFYNQYDTEESLKDSLEKIKIGYEVKLEVIGNKIQSMEILSDKVENTARKPGTPRAPETLKQNLERVNYKTLMAEAHRLGITSTEVNLVPELTDISKKMACFKARVVMKDGKVFEDFGEACGASKAEGGNISSADIALAYIRMASTRALVRVLRQATCNMETAEEEMPEGKLPSDN